MVVPKLDQRDPPMIRAWRKLYNVKQSVLAAEVGIHEVSLSRIETGHQDASVSIAIRIAAALSSHAGREVSVGHLFSDDATAWDALERATNEMQMRHAGQPEYRVEIDQLAKELSAARRHLVRRMSYWAGRGISVDVLAESANTTPETVRALVGSR